MVPSLCYNGARIVGFNVTREAMSIVFNCIIYSSVHIDDAAVSINKGIPHVLPRPRPNRRLHAIVPFARPTCRRILSYTVQPSRGILLPIRQARRLSIGNTWMILQTRDW